jgi:hypothetical protein
MYLTTFKIKGRLSLLTIENFQVNIHKIFTNISALEESLLSRIDYRRPNFSFKDGLRIIEDLYGITGTIKEIPSYEDRNFYFESNNREKDVLKISASSEKREILEFQNKAIQKTIRFIKSNLEDIL